MGKQHIVSRQIISQEMPATAAIEAVSHQLQQIQHEAAAHDHEIDAQTIRITQRTETSISTRRGVAIKIDAYTK